MVLTAQSRDELAKAVAEASRTKTPISQVDLRRLDALVEHTAEDMTATVEAGMTLGAFQELLGRAGQWLPLDPPNAGALSIADLLAGDRSGPRRFGYGVARDFLIGIKVLLASGEVIKAGGKVVKNVAGYDLCKLFIGARHSLGIIVEATFKLRPLPEREIILESRFSTLADLERAARAVLDSPVQPVIVDAHNLQDQPVLAVGFDGAPEDVDYQLDLVRKLGEWRESSTAYDARFGELCPNPRRVSVLPSASAQAMERLGAAAMVARFGNGVIYHNGGEPAVPRELPNAGLLRRVKDAYDPQGIFPEYRP